MKDGITPRVICVMTRLTWRELVRQRYIQVVILLGVFLVAASLILADFSFGRERTTFMVDFGFATLSLFGSLLCVVSTAQILHSDFERETVLGLMARAVSRNEYILGRFLGVWALMALFILLITLVLAALTLGFGGNLPVHAMPETDGGQGAAWGWLLLLVRGGMQWLKFGVIAAGTVLIASYARSMLFTVTVSTMAVGICHLHHLLGPEILAQGNFLTRFLVELANLVFPDFRMFKMDGVLSMDGLAWLKRTLVPAAMAAVYMVLFITLAGYSFGKRDL